jgi:hypothetical protein
VNPKEEPRKPHPHHLPKKFTASARERKRRVNLKVHEA